ncbi:MAG: hypothetical protein EPN34_00270 [Burkholderiaceae bacterium]|nr:MAG: hypothetical protein EPN34_00270 [Burkholderiaceae bacterium]
MKSLLISLTAAAALGACASATQVVLLPHDNAASTLQVSTGRDSRELTGTYAEANVSSGGFINVGQSNADRVQSRYRTLLAIQPEGTRPLPLQFEAGRAELTTQSRTQLDTAIKDAASGANAEIVAATGADGAAPGAADNQLWVRRAQAVRTFMIARGFDPGRIRITSATPQDTAASTTTHAGAPGIFVRMH